jgi:hypothetical protein
MFNFNEKQGLYWFNGQTVEPNINFELIGVLMGLAIFNSVLIEFPFPQACFKKLLDYPLTFEDIKEWQPEIAQSLEFIRNYNNPDVPLEEILGTNFTLTVEHWGE